MKNVIYKISNTINTKCYIGSAVKFNLRFNTHKCQLLKGNHFNKKLQAHVNKYGFDSLVFEIIESDCKNLIEREQFYIDILKPFFNVRLIAQNMTGTKRTTEQINYMISQRMKKSGYPKGRIVSKETRDKIGLAHKGKKISEKQKLEISRKSKGKKLSIEHKAKISFAMLGRQISELTKNKISQKLKGNQNGRKEKV